MMRSTTVPIAAAMLLAGALPGTAAHAATASFELRGYVPVICNAQIGAMRVAVGRTMTIDATVRQTCNSDHKLTVRYLLNDEPDYSAFSLSLGGRQPLSLTRSEARFPSEGFVNDTRPLHLVWTNGSAEDRNRLASTITVVVTPD